MRRRPDPRRDTETKLHLLTDIRTLATGAIIAGADGRERVAAYGPAKTEFFGPFLERANGIPSRDTFGRVFAELDPDALADRFGRGMAPACEATGLTHIAIDPGARSVPDGGHEITTPPTCWAHGTGPGR